MDGIIFTRESDGSFSKAGGVTTKHGRFQWLRPDGHWEGGWAIEPLDKLFERMDQSGPFKYSQYRILPATKALLSIEPCCTSCGLPADIMRAYVVTESDLPTEPLTQWAIDALNYVYSDGQRAYNEDFVAQTLNWWDGEKWTGSPFFNAAVGQSIRCCDYVIDPTVKNAGHDIPAGFTVAPNGLISVKGISGYFCSVFCLAMDRFLYRNRRCAGCGKFIPKGEWTSPEKFRGENYPKYRYCAEACKKKQEKLDFAITSTEHVRQVLGMVPVDHQPRQPRRKKRVPNARFLKSLQVSGGKAVA